MDADGLALSDVEAVLLHGKITRTLEDDSRGARYVIRWVDGNGEILEAVCRFLASGILWIITVYVVKEIEDE